LLFSRGSAFIHYQAKGTFWFSETCLGFSVAHVASRELGSQIQNFYVHRMELHADVHEPSPAFIGYLRKVQYNSFFVVMLAPTY